MSDASVISELTLERIIEIRDDARKAVAMTDPDNPATPRDQAGWYLSRKRICDKYRALVVLMEGEMLFRAVLRDDGLNAALRKCASHLRFRDKSLEEMGLV